MNKMKEELLEISSKLGFISRDNLIEVNDDYYYLWLCELSMWCMLNHNIYVQVNSYHCLGKDKPFGLCVDLLTEEGIWDYGDVGNLEDPNFETYIEALEYGLLESLKIKNKIN